MALRFGAVGSVQNRPISLDGDDDDVDELSDTIREVSVEDDDNDIPTIQAIYIPDDADEVRFIRKVTPRFARDTSPTLPFGHDYLDKVEGPLGATLTPGVCVSLDDGDFLLIKCIIRDHYREVHLKGILLRRVRRINGMLTKKWNELCMILKADITKGHDPKPNDCLVIRPLSLVNTVHDLIRTNRPFPSLSWREPETYNRYVHWNEYKQRYTFHYVEIGEMAVLVARWKYIEFYDPVKGVVQAEGLRWLRENECDAGKGMADELLKRQLRKGEKADKLPARAKAPENLVNLTRDNMKASKGKKRARVDVDLTIEDDGEDYEEEVLETSILQKVRRVNRSGITEKRYRSNSVFTERRTSAAAVRSPFSVSRASSRQTAPPETSARRTYQFSYGDLFSGAGGMASGAEQAGLKPKFLLDFWDAACDTLRRNFGPGVKILQMDVHEFCTANLGNDPYYIIDILHLSPPCQPHSPVHTRAGKDDEKNIAALYSIIPILQKCKPRIVTLEQTSGIVTHGEKEHFHPLIHQFTAMGYSVDWRIVNCAEYGNAQARHRLILIAAAYVSRSTALQVFANRYCSPGEEMPPFPAATHGEEPGLKPFATIRDVLRHVSQYVEPQMRQYTAKDGVRYNSHAVLKKAITCGGGESDLHPNGDRSFTMQELALLQSFLPTHKFAGASTRTMTMLRKQVSNFYSLYVCC